MPKTKGKNDTVSRLEGDSQESEEIPGDAPGGSLGDDFLSNAQAQVDAWWSVPSDDEIPPAKGEASRPIPTGAHGGAQSKGSNDKSLSDDGATSPSPASGSKESNEGSKRGAPDTHDEPVGKRRKGKSRAQHGVASAPERTASQEMGPLPPDVRARMKKKVKFYNYSGDCSGSRTYAWIKPFGVHPVGKHGTGWGAFGSIRVEPILVDIWSKLGYAWEEYVETHEEEEYTGDG